MDDEERVAKEFTRLKSRERFHSILRLLALFVSIEVFVVFRLATESYFVHTKFWNLWTAFGAYYLMPLCIVVMIVILMRDWLGR